jgi:hypothetical protein
MGVLEDTLLGGDPGPDNFYKWGTVTQASPLRVLLDGETAALSITPESLVAGLLVGDRVWCQINRRQLVILGRAANQARNATQELRRVGSTVRTTNGTNSTSVQNVCTFTLPQVLTVTGYKFRIVGHTDVVPDTAGGYTDVEIHAGVNATTGGTIIGSGYVDHRIAGRIVHGMAYCEWTYNLTPNISNANIVLVLDPANGAYPSAGADRPSTLTVDWIVS